MKKYGIVIDSTTVISKEIINKYNIKIASLNITKDKESIKEVDMTFEETGDLIKKHNLKTSQPAPQEFFNCFEELIKEGYENILCFPLSEGISGSYNSALIAKDMIPNNESIHIYNSKICSFAVENLLLIILDKIENGVEFEKLNNSIIELYTNSNISFTVTDLMHLFRGGRLSKLQAALGTILRIKPIVQMIDGKLSLTNKVRTTKSILDFFNNKISEFCNNFKNVYLRIVSLNSDDILNELVESIKDKYNNLKYSITNLISPVFVVHLGTNGIGISICCEN